MSDIETRLREAHPNSQQYALGSKLLLEAADKIRELRAGNGQAVYVVLASQKNSPDEVFVEIESENGQSSAVTSKVDAVYRRIGPLYRHPPSAVVPDSLIETLKIQCSHGNWNYDPYMHGMANGMIFAISCLNNDDPKYLSAPDKWIADYKQPSAVVPEAHINWSNHKQSNDEVPYDHVIGKTPFGNFTITWKSWKESDCPTVDETPWGGFLNAYYDVDEAKSACEAEYKKRIEQAFQQPQEQE